MRTLLTFFFLLNLLLPTAAQEAPTVDADSVAHALRQLDLTIDQKELFRVRRQSQSDSLRAVAAKSRGMGLVAAYLELERHYARVQTDSALYYLNQLEQQPEFRADAALRRTVAIRYADIYAVVGLYTTATEMLKTVDLSAADADTRLSYFQTCRTVYGWMADYASVEDVADDFRELTRQYRDSILAYQTPSVGRDIVLADRLLEREQPDSALAILLADLSVTPVADRAYLYYNISEGYRQKGMDEVRKYYLALTARSDIERGVTEYVALPTLASLLFSQGDIDRAYNYLVCSMEDANYCKARLRSLEAGNIFPIIEHAYNTKERAQRHRERLFIYSFALFALLLMATVLYLRRLVRKVALSRRQLGQANRLLEDANEKLSSANRELTQVGKLKEEYITYYLGQCRGHIDALDKFRATLLRMAKYKQLDELQKTLIKSDSLVEEEQRRFLSQFDKAFLDLHPSFVEHFNAMLRPEARIELRRRDVLTTELRIFALIRLGMSDTADIAKFLSYSTTTIYNYRSRVRGSSIYGREEFESRLMDL